MGRSLIQNIGVNDLPYMVVRNELINGNKKQVWMCKFYKTWKSMITRCYSLAIHKSSPTYNDCVVAKEWLSASRFKEWMESQDWEDKDLDKDILIEGNKIYSPETCVFVSHTVNAFINDSGRIRGDLPIGVCFDSSRGKYVSGCCNPFTGKKEFLGRFTCPQEANQAWRKRKHELAAILANSEFVTDERVAKALINRYRG